jgi:hypothetical protein
VVEVLLAAGADISAADNDGQTALSWAKMGHAPEQVVRMLLAALPAAGGVKMQRIYLFRELLCRLIKSDRVSKQTQK